MPPSEITATSLVPPPMSTICCRWFGHRQTGAIAWAMGSSIIFVGVSRPRVGGLFDGPFLDAGDAEGTQITTADGSTSRIGLPDKVAQYLLGDLEVGR